MQGLRGSELPLDKALSMEYQGAEPVLFGNVWPATPSGKIELQSALLAERYGAALPGFRPLGSSFPLTLITPASDKRITSTFGGLAVNDATPVLEMHPTDAAGEVGLVRGRERRDGLAVAAGTEPGALLGAHHARTHGGGYAQRQVDLAGGACFNDARVEVAQAAA